MSLKSRQRTAAQKLKHVAPPKIALFIAIVGLFFGTVMAVPTRIVTREESVPVTAALSGVEANLRSVRRGSLRKKLHTITVFFEDHDRLHVGRGNANEALLAELSALPTGTVLDMLVQPDSTTILSMCAGEQELIRFEDTVSRLERSNATGAFVSIPFFAMGGYGLWSLLRCWQYRRVLHAHL